MNDEVELIQEDSKDTPELYIRLSGLLIEEEIDFLINLCKDDTSNNKLPLFIHTDNEDIEIGDLSISLDNLLAIYSISDQYILELVDSIDNKSEIIFGTEDNKKICRLDEFITI